MTLDRRKVLIYLRPISAPASASRTQKLRPITVATAAICRVPRCWRGWR
jgi:hypothetical protein